MKNGSKLWITEKWKDENFREKQFKLKSERGKKIMLSIDVIGRVENILQSQKKK